MGGLGPGVRLMGAFNDNRRAVLTAALVTDSPFDSPDLALHRVDRLIGRGAAPADLPEACIAHFRHHQRRKSAKEDT